MGIDDLVNKGKRLLDQHHDQIQGAVHSEHAEGISDKLLDGAARTAKKVTGGTHDEQIDRARDSADKSVGNQ
jgi:hypothetical protein